MEPRDLTPAAATHDTPYGASEARVEIEAFLGDGWVTDAGYQFVRASRFNMSVQGTGQTLRAAVSALKQAWRDAVRPWVESSFDEGCDYIGNEKNVEQHVRISRVLKEDQ